MRVIICVDHSAYTEKVLQAAKLVLGTRMPQPEIIVLHVLDMTLFPAEKNEQVPDELKANSKKVLEMCKEYLGSGFQYVEATGIPRMEIDEVLNNTAYDLLIVGTRGRSMVANVLLGSISEHLLHEIKKPLLIVP